MKKIFFAAILLVAVIHLRAQRDYTALVNPFIGTGGHGHTYPGASMPFGMMQLSPDTRGPDWDGSGGYHYSDSVIYGFSHTHLSGTGIPDYCDLLLMPFTGETHWDNKEYRSGFHHVNEKAEPGYYEVLLDKQKIKAQLSVSLRCGIHQYTFQKDVKTASVLIDLQHRDQLLDVFIEKVSATEIRGYRVSKYWAQNQRFYFTVVFDQPIVAVDSMTAEFGPRNERSGSVKWSLKFNLPKAMLRCKVGISAVSMEGAMQNLSKEITDWDISKLRSAAKTAWNKELSKIDVQGGTHDEQVVFYTSLYHTSLVPNLFQDVDGKYRGTDDKVHVARGFTNYTVFSLWDTYRAYHPLMNMINTRRTTDWINTFLMQYRNGGMLPVWELAGNETYCMIGYHSVPVIADAYQKGIRGFDTKLALEAMRSYAESDRFGLRYYRELGYIPNDKESESVSKTLEYAYDDWCIAQFAKMTNVDSVYRMYTRRAQNFKNVFDPSTMHMRGKLQAMWVSPFEPREINNFFTEGNSWQYSFAVPQDVETLMTMLGGEQGFRSMLDKLFSTSSETTGREQPDVTGLIGQYAQGNEPSHHMAYLYNYAGRFSRTQELVQFICSNFYKNAPDGLIGNEDCGQMSAWYVLSAMGIYPVCPGSGEYALGIPVFDKIRIRLENGKTVSIEARNRKAGNNYVAGLMFNGNVYTKSYVLHKELVNNGKLVFNLGVPAAGFEASLERPHSKISDEQITPAPFFNTATNKFQDSMLVSMGDADRSAVIFFRMKDSTVKEGTFFKQYTGPFVIRNSATVEAFAGKEGEYKPVSQTFFKLPGDRTVSVNSKVSAMYTAGGNEALIDGIEGDFNWRSGEWQGYFNQDFEAVVDLKSSRQINYAGVHVLQDVSPWILYPKELIVSTSIDGIHFEEAARVVNAIPSSDDKPQTQRLGSGINRQARFVKIIAINGGPLPSWHESAGNPSHLFIDELIVR